MRKFVMLSPNFWVGQTGRDLRAAGTEAQLLAIYLISNTLTNYTGLYRLPIIYIANDLGLTMEQTREALAAVEKTGFARYDERTEFVWVVEAARHQLGEELKASDNKVKYVNKEFAAITKACPFLADYYAKYSQALHLKARADVVAAAPAKAAELPKPEPEVIAAPAPQPEAAPVVAAAPVKAPAVAVEVEVEDVAEAVQQFAAEHDAPWKETSAADDVAYFLQEREANGCDPAGAKAITKKLLTFAATHGEYALHQVVNCLANSNDYELTNWDAITSSTLDRLDI